MLVGVFLSTLPLSVVVFKIMWGKEWSLTSLTHSGNAYMCWRHVLELFNTRIDKLYMISTSIQPRNKKHCRVIIYHIPRWHICGVIAKLGPQKLVWSQYMDRRSIPQIAKFMGPTWGPPGSCRPQMGPMLAPWTLLSGTFWDRIIKAVAAFGNRA